MFTGPRTFWLDADHVCVQETTQVRRDVREVWPQIWHDRWAEAGWRFHKQINAAGDAQGFREKELPHRWMLRLKFARGYELEHVRSKAIWPFPGWTWADLDHNRLVWAEKGCLFTAGLDRETGVRSPTLLHDFNAMKFEAREAPY